MPVEFPNVFDPAGGGSWGPVSVGLSEIWTGRGLTREEMAFLVSRGIVSK